MKKFVWLALVLALVMVVGMVAFSTAETMTDIKNEIEDGTPRVSGDPGGAFAYRFNKVGLGALYNEALHAIVIAGGWANSGSPFQFFDWSVMGSSH